MGSLNVQMCELCGEDQVGRMDGGVCEAPVCGGRVRTVRRAQRFLDRDPFVCDATEGDEYREAVVAPPPPSGHPTARALLAALGPDDEAGLGRALDDLPVSQALRTMLTKGPALARALDALALRVQAAEDEIARLRTAPRPPGA